MLNNQTFFLKIIKQSLALAIIFCLSGMASIVCCFTKCQVVEKTCHQSSTNLTTKNSCHENSFEEIETCASTDETALENSCSQNTSQTCSSTNEPITDCKDNLNSCEFSLTNNLEDGFNGDSSCRMKCCLPSEEVVDVPRIPRVDNLKVITSEQVSYPDVVKEKQIFFTLPIKKEVNQEKTYLRCCVFLI